MAIYKISDLLECLNDYARNGFEYVEIDELEPDEDDPASLSIEAFEEENSTIADSIDAVTLPAGYICHR